MIAIPSRILRPVALAREVVDLTLSVAREVAEQLVYSALRRRLGLPQAEAYVRDLERRIDRLEARAEARKVVRFPSRAA
jgi:hypothetical protein